MTHRAGDAHGILLGVGIGIVVLGIGGRLAMRGISLATNQPGGFSLGGTMTVVLLGACSGAVGGLLLVILQRILPRHAWVRGTLFWIILILLTLRGLHAFQPFGLAFFMPLVAVYGALMQWAWMRLSYRPLAKPDPMSARAEGSEPAL